MLFEKLTFEEASFMVRQQMNCGAAKFWSFKNFWLWFVKLKKKQPELKYAIHLTEASFNLEFEYTHVHI